MRRVLLGWLFLGGVAACGAARPCSTCPAIEGEYRLDYGAVASATGCTDSVPFATELSVSRNGSSLSATHGSWVLGGVLYESFDFTLFGTGHTEEPGGAVRVRGRYRQGVDGGVLEGTYTLTRSKGESSELPCRTERPFVGTESGAP